MSEERGSALIESAITLSLLFFLLFGVVETARYISVWHGANTAAREGARYGIAVGVTGPSDPTPRYRNCDAIVDAALRLSGLADLDASDISVTYDDGTTATTVHDCASGTDPDASAIDPGDRVVVTVSRQFNPITPLFGEFLDGITVDATDRRTIFLEATP